MNIEYKPLKPDDVIRQFDNLPGACNSAHPNSTDNTFPIASFPAPLSTYINQASTSLNIDASMIGLPLLTGLASAIGHTRMIQIDDDWLEPSILWGALVQSSGSGKSPAANASLVGVNYENQLLQSQYSPESDQPRKFSIVTDATIEKLIDLSQNNPRGLLIHRDELAGLLDFDKYRQGKSGNADWLSLWSGQQWSVHRKGSGSQFVNSPRISIYGTIQPAILKRHMCTVNTSSGLMARFLFAMPERRRRYLSHSTIDPQAKESIHSIFRKLYMLELNPEDEPVILKFSSDAYNAFKTKHDQLVDQQSDLEEGPLSAAITKLQAYLARLSLVLHCVSLVLSEIRNEIKIEESTVTNAGRLIDFFLNEARKVYEATTIPAIKEMSNSERNKMILQLNKQGLSNTEIGNRFGITEGAVRYILKDKQS